MSAYIQGPLTVIADTPVDFGCVPGDIAVGTGYQLSNVVAKPVLIQPLSVSGYQFTFTGAGADIWVSCISPSTPVALTARSDESVQEPAHHSRAGRPKSKPSEEEK